MCLRCGCEMFFDVTVGEAVAKDKCKVGPPNYLNQLLGNYTNYGRYIDLQLNGKNTHMFDWFGESGTGLKLNVSLKLGRLNVKKG